MSNQHSARRNRSLQALIAGLARLVHDQVIDPVRRHARWRGGERELARLDDRMLRDIGLTRSQVHAAAYGLLTLGEHSPVRSMRTSPSGPGDVRLKGSAIALSVDQVTGARLAARAARG